MTGLHKIFSNATTSTQSSLEPTNSTSSDDKAARKPHKQELKEQEKAEHQARLAARHAETRKRFPNAVPRGQPGRVKEPLGDPNKHRGMMAIGGLGGGGI